MLWLVCRGYAGQDGRVSEVDTATGAVVGLYGPFTNTVPTVFGVARGCIQLYGIGVDQLGDIWVGGFTCNDVIKLSGADGTLMGVEEARRPHHARRGHRPRRQRVGGVAAAPPP